MVNGTADVTVHIDETFDHARLEKVAEGVRRSSGVSSVDFHDKKPHFMLVRYDPSMISSNDIHRLVTEQGVHAEMIGL